MQKITTFLWYDHQAEEAANFYVDVFNGRPEAKPDSSNVVEVLRYGSAGPGEAGTVMTVAFRLDGQEYTALNGGPSYTFNESVSLMVNCETQEEVDYLWDKLTGAGGEPGPCGWLKDSFGVSWQITPIELTEMLRDPDQVKAQAAMKAQLSMGKYDIAELRRAFANARS